jgi:hypothetical protein
MSKVSPWLDHTPPIDVRTLDIDQLIELWSANRNNIGSLIAAEEVMKRLAAERKPK